MTNETVLEHFDGHACYKDQGGCAFHDHIHVQHNPEGYGQPLCDGGSGPPPKGGWSSAGSPNLTAFKAELDRQIAAGAFPGIKHGAGFNCRFIAGTTSWSQHAYWNAVDIQAVDYAERWKVLDPVWAWLHSPWEPAPIPPEEEDFLMALTEQEQDFVYAQLNADQCERAGYLCATGINKTPSVTVGGESVKVNKDSTVEDFGSSWALFNAFRSGLNKAGVVTK